MPNKDVMGQIYSLLNVMICSMLIKKLQKKVNNFFLENTVKTMWKTRTMEKYYQDLDTKKESTKNIIPPKTSKLNICTSVEKLQTIF